MALNVQLEWEEEEGKSFLTKKKKIAIISDHEWELKQIETILMEIKISESSSSYILTQSFSICFADITSSTRPICKCCAATGFHPWVFFSFLSIFSN